MIRYKTKKQGQDAYHIVKLVVMPYVQSYWAHNNAIPADIIVKTYKTQRGAEKGLKDGEVVVWEKAMGA
jgi:hypothetical protein